MILRECRGRMLALLNRVFQRTHNSNPTRNTYDYYVESEPVSNRYYFVEYKNDSNFCTCWDYAYNNQDKSKHISVVEYAIHLGLVQSIYNKLLISTRDTNTRTVADQYKNESIRKLNILEKAEIEAEKYNKTQRQQFWELDDYSF